MTRDGRAGLTMRSAVDAWLVAVLAAAAATALVPLARGGAPAEIAAGLVAVGALLAAIVLLGWPCTYTLAEDRLLIRSGLLLRVEIPYARMRDAYPSCNPLSAPAWSLRRIRIDLDRGIALISPLDRERFLAELRQRIEDARTAAAR